jgi:signal transduction histidine kinase
MTKKFNVFLDENKTVRDELKEDTIYLKKYNEQLKIDREKNIHIAILTERNRIARELHDSIGHAISSSILQVEALKIVSDNTMLESLNLLQDTLNNGMNDIRNSIHNLYNESLDLKNRIESLCSEIPTIEIDLIYRLGDDLPYDLKFDILSIIREAITNCVKHSNATELKISLLNQPKFYSIIIKDNGSKFNKTDNLLTKGIGLLSMNEIANKYNGFLNYEFDNGFKIHLTLMKG